MALLSGLLIAVILAKSCTTSVTPILQYSTDDGTFRSESGDPGRRVRGGWSWFDEFGKEHKIWYIADEFGFRAYGDIVPTIAPTTAKPVVTSSTSESSPTQAVTELYGWWTTHSELTDTTALQTLGVTESALPEELKEGTEFLSDGSRIFSDFTTESSSFLDEKSSGFQKTKHTAALQDSDLVVSESKAVPKQRKTKSWSSKVQGSFTLVNKLRHPTARKERRQQGKLSPRPVVVDNDHKPTISGLSKSTSFKEFDKLGPSISRLAHEGPQPDITDDRPVPMPMKLEGMLDLDNFFAPKTLLQERKSKTFEIPSPTDDFDYISYDYYDYDVLGPHYAYQDYPTTKHGTPKSKQKKDTDKKVEKSKEEEEEERKEKEDECDSIEDK